MMRDLFYRFSSHLFMGLLFYSASIPWGHAGAVLDGTLQPENAGLRLKGNFVIPDTMGQTRGPNLFHSFGTFNINLGESATFTGPAVIDNVISRVTGGSRSFIDGPLRSEIESANLWFINPSGVLFGEHASLDVDGSFHVSTADYLRLADGGQFNATNPNNSILTTASPEAFGFLGDHPAPIDFQGSSLSVPEGKTFSVVSGDIEITGGSLLQAPGGQFNLASVASAGKVTLGSEKLGTESFARFGRIDMAQGSAIDVSGEGGGSIFIRGGQFVMDNSFVRSNTQGDMDGGNLAVKVGSLQLKDGAQIATRTDSPGKGGDVAIEAENIVLKGLSSILANALEYGSGGAGNLTVTARNSLQLKGGSEIVSNTFGPGQGGDGAVKVNSLQLKDGAQIASRTFGPGQAGNLAVEAENIVLEGGEEELRSGLFANAEEGSSGDAGNLTATARNSLQLKDGAQIAAATKGPGKGGNVAVNAENMVLEGGFGEFSTAILSATVGRAPGSGDAGNLTATARNSLQLKDGAQIGAGTFGPGKGGNVVVEAENIVLEGVAQRVTLEGKLENFESGLRAAAERGSTGNAGAITVTARNSLQFKEGATISVETDQSDAGNITLHVGSLLHLHDSSITTSVAEGRGDGGNIAIDPVFVVMDNSQIIAKAERGRGGDIRITTDFLFKSPDSAIDASSEFGVSGTVEIDPPDTDVSAGLLALPASFFDAAAVLTRPCAERSEADVIRLVVRKYEVLPDSPYALRVYLPSAGSGPSVPSDASPSTAIPNLHVTRDRQAYTCALDLE